MTRRVAVVSVVLGWCLFAAMPAQALTETVLSGNPGAVAMPATIGVPTSVVSGNPAMLNFPRRFANKSGNTATSYPERIQVTYRVWQYDSASSSWVFYAKKSRARTASGDTLGATLPQYIFGVDVDHWYYTDVIVKWKDPNSLVTHASAKWAYDARSDYTCQSGEGNNCWTWQGTGIAGIYVSADTGQ